MIYDDNRVEAIRRRYPAGTEICLDYMRGESRMQPGLKGKVAHVDDAGQIHVHWENGSGLALIPGEDAFHRVQEPRKDKDRGEASR